MEPVDLLKINKYLTNLFDFVSNQPQLIIDIKSQKIYCQPLRKVYYDKDIYQICHRYATITDPTQLSTSLT